MTGYRAAIAEGERVGSTHVLVPPRTLAAGAGGTRISRRAGGSLEFRDHRDYEPGDDLRHLDWNVFARSDRLTVKQFHEEIADEQREAGVRVIRPPHALGFLDAELREDLRESAGAPPSVVGQAGIQQIP